MRKTYRKHEINELKIKSNQNSLDSRFQTYFLCNVFTLKSVRKFDFEKNNSKRNPEFFHTRLVTAK